MFAIAAWRLDAWFAGVAELLMTVAFLAAAASAAYLRAAENARGQNAARALQEERTELSRELHDVVGHYMTGIVLQAQAARLVLDSRPELARHALDEIETAGGEALRSLRLMVRGLRSESSSPLTSPVATLDDFHDLGRAAAGDTRPVRLEIDPGIAALPAALVASLHRIALEAVTNARRHAPEASAIDVRLALGPGDVVLEIHNDGPVSARRAGSAGGFGLVGIGERVRALGGELVTGPRPEGGWSVRVAIPLPAGVR